MASLNIDFSYDDNVKRSINGAKSSLSTRINDYAGIKRNLSNMSSSTGNLSTANTYIQKKINALQSKYDKLESFRTAVTNFNTNAEAADRRVANRINTETNQFYKREGIQTGILYTIGSVLGKGADWLRGKIEEAFDAFITGAKTVWANIKQWYEDNKHWIDVVIDVVCVVAAIAGIVATILTGGTFLAVAAGVFFGVWGLAKAGTDLVYDSIALSYYNKGDMEKYEEYSQTGLKDVMAEHLGPAGEYLYYGMEIASAIYSIYKIGDSVYKFAAKDGPFYKIANGSIGTKWYSAKDLSAVTKIAKFADSANFNKVLKAVRVIDMVSGNTAFVAKGYKNLMTSGSLIEATVKSVKITKIGWDLASNFNGIANMSTSKSGNALGTLLITHPVVATPMLSVSPVHNISVNFNLISAPVCAAA